MPSSNFELARESQIYIPNQSYTMPCLSLAELWLLHTKNFQLGHSLSLPLFPIEHFPTLLPTFKSDTLAAANSEQ